MITRNRLLLGLALLVALLLTWFQIPVASSQGLSLAATKISGELPLTDPTSRLWQQATAIEVPLSAQNITHTMLLQTRIKSVATRALYNDQQLALLVEWADPTQNDQTVRIQDFRDGVAVQFPLADGQPDFCMGQEGGDVNIWHWKADWQTEIFAHGAMTATYPNLYVDQYPFTAPADDIMLAKYSDPNYLTAQTTGNLMASPSHASPVEDMMAGGFGTLTAQPVDNQNVQGYGTWSNGRWHVIFSRDLTSSEEHDISFAPDKIYSVAFAAWDGDNRERGGEKSTSQWISLQFGSAVSSPSSMQGATASATSGGITGIVVMGVLGIVLITAAWFAYYRKMSQRKMTQ